MTTSFDALRKLERDFCTCGAGNDGHKPSTLEYCGIHKKIAALEIMLESSHSAEIQAAQVEMQERCADAMRNCFSRVGGAYNPLRIVAEIRALPLTTHALDIDRLRTRREEHNQSCVVCKPGDMGICARAAKIDRQIAELEKSSG